MLDKSWCLAKDRAGDRERFGGVVYAPAVMGDRRTVNVTKDMLAKHKRL
jgi:hypothetical protein